MFQEFLLTFFQRDRVYHRFALKTFQTGFNNFPFRRVYHHRNTGYLRFGSYQIEESSHFLTSIQQTVIHIHIDNQRTVFHLLTGNGKRFVILLLINQTQKFTRTGHITTFADIHKIYLGLYFQKFKPGKPKTLRFPNRHMWASPFY